MKDVIEMMSVRNYIAAEVTPEEALMSYLGVMRNLPDDDVLTVMLRVLVAQDYQRLVTDIILMPTQSCPFKLTNKYREQEEIPAHEIDPQGLPVSVVGLEHHPLPYCQRKNQPCTQVARRGRSKKSSPLL